MIDSYVYVIIALLPLAALILVFQVNPYHALVVRAILGAVAALVYAVLGAADVALTEALIGTMLAVMLYVVAVRSSLVMRLGILQTAESESYFVELIANLRKIVNQHNLRLELVEYPSLESLEQALLQKEVHATCAKPQQLEPRNQSRTTRIDVKQTYHTAIRVRRLFEIIQTELNSQATTLTYITASKAEDQH